MLTALAVRDAGSVLLRVLVVCASALGNHASAAELAFDEARAALMSTSHRLKASESEITKRELEEKAAATLGLPDITLNATEVLGRKEFDISNLPIINSINFTYNFDGPRSSLGMRWPIYTGGRITATQNALAAELDGARAERRGTEEGLDLELIQRYFGLRLAANVEALRAAQLTQADRQLDRAKRFEQRGQTSAVERLSTQVSRDEAARDFAKAKRDREIAAAGLARFLQRSLESVIPSTPLFVVTAPLQPVVEWIRNAEGRNSTLAALSAKSTVADQGINVARASFLPEVFAFANYQLVTRYLTPIEPNWIAGVGVNITLFSALDRASKVGAARAQKDAIDSLTEEARVKIRTAVETAWLRVAQAREQFELYDSSVELARENLRLRERAQDEGLATALEVSDARNAQIRAETGRAQVAYEFVVALGQLLEVSGQTDRILEFIARADVKL